MEYYKLLQLKREPFSNTPDPDYFFESRQHVVCLQKLELALRLKRGLNVVIGDVGTGKTTLCRELIRRLDGDERIETHLILDPSFDTPMALLELLHTMLRGHTGMQGGDGSVSEMTVKERIKQALFEKGVERDMTLVLIIDEGQKISAAVMEILRELLNYETNRFKLLQIVIFAQQEFETLLEAHPNFADRINLLHRLEPLGFADTRNMIRHRIKLSSRTPKPMTLFSLPALWAIYRASRGYPRRIIHLCHQSILTLIIQNRTRAGWSLIRSCKRRLGAKPGRRRRRLALSAALAATALAVVFILPAGLFEHDGGIQKQFYNIVGNETSPPLPSPPAGAPPMEPTAEPPPAQGADLHQAEGDRASAVAMVHETIDNKAQAATAPPPEPTIVEPAAVVDPASMEPPRLLGHVPVKPGDTMLGLVRTVYGNTANRYVRAVIEANPQIENPNAIDLDDVIAFPAIRYPVAEHQRQTCCIVLDERDTLPAALQRRNELKQEAFAPVRIIAHWTPVDGLRFTLAVDKPFAGPVEAMEYAGTLPHAVRIQSGWPEEVQFFSAYFPSRK